MHLLDPFLSWCSPLQLLAVAQSSHVGACLRECSRPWLVMSVTFLLHLPLISWLR